MFKLLLLSITLYLSLNVVSNPRVKNGFDLRGSEVSYRLIYKGGPPKDGIPALTHPKFIPVNQASFLNVDDRVLVLKVGEIVKIYPLKIMDYHEVVNDSIGGVPVLVTYCPLCGSGVAFSRQLDDIELTFVSVQRTPHLTNFAVLNSKALIARGCLVSLGVLPVKTSDSRME